MSSSTYHIVARKAPEPAEEQKVSSVAIHLGEIPEIKNISNDRPCCSERSICAALVHTMALFGGGILTLGLCITQDAPIPALIIAGSILTLVGSGCTGAFYLCPSLLGLEKKEEDVESLPQSPRLDMFPAAGADD